jgi:uncharacterized pyridoxal phosphate-containing UPF0001 family protein
MTIQVRLKKLLDTIRETETRYGRLTNSVQLIAVSKTKPASAIATAYQAGQRHFGVLLISHGILLVQFNPIKRN